MPILLAIPFRLSYFFVLLSISVYFLFLARCCASWPVGGEVDEKGRSWDKWPYPRQSYAYFASGKQVHDLLAGSKCTYTI